MGDISDMFGPVRRPSTTSVYEVDPLLCPLCGSEMKILAFIFDFRAAKAPPKASSSRPKSPSPWLTRLRRRWSSSPNPPAFVAFLFPPWGAWHTCAAAGLQTAESRTRSPPQLRSPGFRRLRRVL